MIMQRIIYSACLFFCAISYCYASPTPSLSEQQLDAFKSAAHKAPLLFVASAEQSKLKLIAGQTQEYELTLYQVKPTVVYFTNRPQRIIGELPMRDFIHYWYDGSDSFADVPPNADFVAVAHNKLKQFNFVFTLTKINYDPIEQKLTFVAKLLTPANERQNIFLKSLSFTNLFIDFNWNNNTP